MRNNFDSWVADNVLLLIAIIFTVVCLVFLLFTKEHQGLAFIFGIFSAFCLAGWIKRPRYEEKTKGYYKQKRRA